MVIETPETLQARVDAYFATCAEEKKPLTMSGLACALRTTRQQLLEGDLFTRKRYPKMREKVCQTLNEIVERAKTRCAAFAEEQLYDKEGLKGAEFTLKNNFGWQEKGEIRQENDATVRIELEDEAKRWAK